MLIACWSPKGGSGTTVVTVALSLALAADSPGGVLLADLAGDVPAVLGLPDPSGLGLADWLTAENDVPDDALDRLEIDAGPGLRLLPASAASATTDAGRSPRGRALAAALARDPRPVVVDCGGASDGAGLEVATAADASLLVLRPCYLAVRRAMSSSMRRSAVVLVAERERSLGSRDIEEILDTPIRAVVPVEPSIARAVDAGLLARRMPRPLSVAITVLVESLPARAGADGSSTATSDGARRRSSPRRGALRR